MGATLTDGTAFSAVAPSQRPVCDTHQPKYSETVFRSCPPGPNTWTLNIQPLGQFRPHRGFLLARSTLLTSVARLLQPRDACCFDDLWMHKSALPSLDENASQSSRALMPRPADVEATMLIGS
jgi:hypothetical protein